MLYSETVEKLAEFYPLHPIQSDGHSHSTWFIPENHSLPLTLVWGDEKKDGISAILALGRFPEELDGKIPLELLTINLMMAASGGPKFSYSRSSSMLTLISPLSSSLIEDSNIYAIRDAINALIDKSHQARLHMENEGIKLSENQE
ncbi:type III secretion system chaperone [Pantoea sp. PNT02]|uniref:type III secretion system chaperone n=1 Tax=Pantoea sp. PNT02 TaxID=2769261 RepID=UPI00177F0C52|nr:type III secretion system chaperone [Pantoea sp. PNT02]MBD9646341.1 type III secretion system chaperone [Pantoea sp. PNT02]